MTPIGMILLALRGRSELRAMFFGFLSLGGVAIVGAMGCAASILMQILVTLLVLHNFPHQGMLVGISRFSFYANCFGPIEEELMYQCAVQTWIQRLGPLLAVLITTLLFALSHILTDYVAFTMTYREAAYYFSKLFVSLLVFAFIRQKTKSFGAATFAHLMNNAIASSIHDSA